MGSSRRRRARTDGTKRGQCRLAASLLLPLIATAFGCAAPHQSVPVDRSQPTAPILPAWETLGSSRDGRPVRALTLQRRQGSAASTRVALIAGIHGDEREGGRHLAELLDLLTTCDGTIRVYEDVNPDGTGRHARTTSKGVDPNRNWPAENFLPSRQRGPAPLSEPGVAAVHADLVQFDPELVIVLHSTSRGPFVNFDGPAVDYAWMFANAAGTPWTVQPSMGYPTPGSFGSWMGVDKGVPTLTIEFQRDCLEAESRPALLAGVQAVLLGEDVPTAGSADPFVIH